MYLAESRSDYQPKAQIRSSSDVAAQCGSLARRRVEVFAVLLLNARHDVIRSVVVSTGTLTAALVHPREVFRPAIVTGADAVILVHNHPSGDPEPSGEDVAITRRIAQAGEILGIRVLDHVVVARGGRFVSLRERGHFSGE